MKKIVRLIISIVFFCFSAVPIYASSDVYVEDTYGVLTQDEVNDLQQLATDISDKYAFGVYARIIQDDTEESYNDMDTFSENYYRQQDLGYGNTSNGVLLLITQCSQGGSYQVMIPPESNMNMFTLDGMDRMDEKAYAALKNHDYYQAIYDYLTEADSLMQYYNEYDEAYGSNYGYDTEYTSDNTGVKYACVFGIPMFLASIIVFVLQRKNKTKYTAATANQYITKNGVHLTNARDMYLYRTVTRTPIHHDDGGGSSPGGSHFSSSGGMHSGGGHF